MAGGWRGRFHGRDGSLLSWGIGSIWITSKRGKRYFKWVGGLRTWVGVRHRAGEEATPLGKD